MNQEDIRRQKLLSLIAKDVSRAFKKQKRNAIELFYSSKNILDCASVEQCQVWISGVRHADTSKLGRALLVTDLNLERLARLLVTLNFSIKSRLVKSLRDEPTFVPYVPQKDYPIHFYELMRSIQSGGENWILNQGLTTRESRQERKTLESYLLSTRERYLQLDLHEKAPYLQNLEAVTYAINGGRPPARVMYGESVRPLRTMQNNPSTVTPFSLNTDDLTTPADDNL